MIIYIIISYSFFLYNDVFYIFIMTFSSNTILIYVLTIISKHILFDIDFD